MRALGNVTAALKIMRSSRTRSLFTMLGVIIAVAAVTTVVSIGDGVKQSILLQANKSAKNVLTIRPASLSDTSDGLNKINGGGSIGVLTAEDLKTVAKQPHVTSAVSLSVAGNTAQGDYEYKGPVVSVDGDLPAVVNYSVAYGAFFADTDAANNVAVLGAKAASALYNANVPLGHGLTINGQEFIIGGILNSVPVAPLSGGFDANNTIFIPKSAAASVAPAGAVIYQILAKIDDAKNVEPTAKKMQSNLSKEHGGQEMIKVLTPSELATKQTVTLGLLAKLTVAAAAITLLVSGIGIMNVMLVSVSERMHEIGIRKAVGATNRQILGQFITEAVMLSVIGSILGVILAAFACFLLGVFTDLHPHFNWAAAGLSCLAACGLGILFGVIPAARAARKDPITALRSQ